MRKISQDRIEKYMNVTQEALEKAENASKEDEDSAEEVLDMVRRYLSDAKFFRENEEYVDCFASLNYAHGWLDCGARLGFYDVDDDTLFTVSE